MPSSTKIIRLLAENVKRLRAVEIRPDGAIVQIRGRNGQGKSSVLDSIWLALGGRKAFPRQPVREGETEARIELELEDLIITRKIKPDGQTSLVVANKDGARYPSPQALLDTLVAGLSFDPLAFARMKPAEQREVLRQLVGIDTSAIESERDGHYNRRTNVNREVRRLEGEVSGFPHHEDAPAEEVSVKALSEELGHAEEYQRQIDAAEREVEKVASELGGLRDHLDVLDAEIRTLERQLAQVQERKHKGTTVVIPEKEAALEAARGQLDELRAGAPDREALRAQLAGAEETNRRVRDNSRRAALEAQLAKEAADAAKLTEAINELDRQKAEVIAGARYPLEGLAVDGAGVLLNDLPLEQASSAEQLRASVAIGLALNPQLRVLLVRDGSLLDEGSLALLGEMAAAADAQVWLEVVGDGEGVGVVIEDGAVREPGAST